MYRVVCSQCIHTVYVNSCTDFTSTFCSECKSLAFGLKKDKYLTLKEVEKETGTFIMENFPNKGDTTLYIKSALNTRFLIVQSNTVRECGIITHPNNTSIYGPYTGYIHNWTGPDRILRDIIKSFNLIFVELDNEFEQSFLNGAARTDVNEEVKDKILKGQLFIDEMTLDSL